MTSENFLDALNDDLRGNPVLIAGAPSPSDVDQIEAFAGFPLPCDYRAFVQKYGAAIVGPYSVYGVGTSEAMGATDRSVRTVTEHFRADGWPGSENSLVISTDHAGNPITIDSAGFVYKFDHDLGTTDLLSTSFASFVMSILDSK
jgi:hypothetical protein